MLPTGTVTFLMTDIEGSTRAWERRPEALRSRCRGTTSSSTRRSRSHGGVRPVEQGEGDSVVAAFSRATDAVGAALAAQRMLGAEAWPDGVGLRCGWRCTPVRRSCATRGTTSGWRSSAVPGCRSCGHGGQVLLSDVTAALVVDELPGGAGLADLGRHRLKDLGRPERVWQLMHPDLEAEFPPLMSLDSFRQNLPLQLSPLIGRRAEIAELVAVLGRGTGGDADRVGRCRQDPVGVGGGRRVGRRVPGRRVVRRAGGDARRLARSAGRRSRRWACRRRRGWRRRRWLRSSSASGGRSLVILDNCEHLIAECAEFVVTVLGASPTVSVLATSREQLGVAGEVAWRVPSLPSPPRDGMLPVEALSQYDAVNLFVDRARRARPSFTVNESNAAAIAQVCHRLDGIPLAVELAAARCRHLSSEQIAGRVGRSVPALDRRITDGHAAAADAWRHRSSGATSCSTMSSDGFCVVSACSLDRSRCRRPRRSWPHRVTSIRSRCSTRISRLVDKSLVLADDPDGASPYRLLETIRAFAIQRAREAGELASAARHPRRLVVRPARRARRHRSDRRRHRARRRQPRRSRRRLVVGRRPRRRGRSSPVVAARPRLPGNRTRRRRHARRSTRCWRPPSSSNTPSTGCAPRSPPRSRCSAFAARRPSASCSPDASRAPSTWTTTTARPSPGG